MRKATAKDFQILEILKIMLFSFASLLSGTEGSSLIYMVKDLIELSNHPEVLPQQSTN
jgi:hypothetical protein